MSSCIHAKQRYSGYMGHWICVACDKVVEPEPFEPSKLDSVKINGLYAFARQRDYGKTGREMARENRETFRKEKGYDPVSATERWI